MSDIEFNKQFTMPRETLNGELEQLVSDLGQRLQLNCEWLSDDCLDFRRSGVEGRVEIADEELTLTIKLGMLMGAFKGTIEAEIQDFMEQHIY